MLDRRRFLAGLAAAAAAAAATGSVAGCSDDGDGDAEEAALPDGVFALGVASGDPLADSVILWTRLAPRPTDGGGMPDADVRVRWEVATDEAFADIVADGSSTAVPAFAHSVHVDAKGLEPDTAYWYRFVAGGQTSPVGRTRTAPAADQELDRLRFVFASCQDWRDGYYSAWGHAAEEDVDLVVFLGDYIYENGDGDEDQIREHGSDEVFTLDDYRNRYGLYKGDTELQAAHARFPWILVWDDHEVDNNYAGVSGETQPTPSEDEFRARRAAAYQAYYEHQPVRVDPPDGSDLVLYREVAYGRLASFFVVDTRQYRSDQPCTDSGDIGAPCPERTAPGNTLIGDEQAAWLADALGASRARWNVLANQVVMTPLPFGPLFNLDQWDGYPGDRTRVLEILAREEVSNPVVLTGDIHASGVGDLMDDRPGAPVVGTELVGTSISSSFDEDLATAAESLLANLPQVKWFYARARGYVRCEVSPDQWRTDFRRVSTVTETRSEIATDTSWVVRDGTPGAVEA